MKESVFLQFIGYEIEKLSIEKSEKINKNSNVDVLYKIVPNSALLEKANVIQGILIEGTKDFPYTLEVVLKGNFILGEEFNNEEKKQLLLNNAAAILFPYVRSCISLLSSQTDYNKIVLPTINFSKMFEKTDVQEIFIDEKYFEDF